MMADIFQNSLVLYYLTAALLALPVVRIYRRAGFRPYWAALLAVPEAGLVLCAVVLALCKWPAQKQGEGV